MATEQTGTRESSVSRTKTYACFGRCSTPFRGVEKKVGKVVYIYVEVEGAGAGLKTVKSTAWKKLK